ALRSGARHQHRQEQSCCRNGPLHGTPQSFSDLDTAARPSAPSPPDVAPVLCGDSPRGISPVDDPAFDGSVGGDSPAGDPSLADSPSGRARFLPRPPRRPPRRRRFFGAPSTSAPPSALLPAGPVVASPLPGPAASPPR